MLRLDQHTRTIVDVVIPYAFFPEPTLSKNMRTQLLLMRCIGAVKIALGLQAE